MTRITITLAALAALAAAAPAAAQYGNRYDSYAADGVDIQGLGAELDAAVSRGDVSSRDARSLSSQLRGLANLQRQYAQNGLTASERYDLQQRAQGLRNEIADAGGYASGYGRSDGRYRNDDRYDDRAGNRSDRYGAYDRGDGYGYDRSGAARMPYDRGTYGSAYGNRTSSNAPYNEGYADRGYGSGRDGGYDRGQAARNDGRYDRDDDAYDDEDGPALRAGDRAPDGLYGVPDEYRARFRDSPYFYYRYGAGNVYQIDTRNRIVTRVIRVDR